MKSEDTKLIRIKESTYDSLVDLGKKNESFDDIVKKLVEEYKKKVK